MPYKHLYLHSDHYVKGAWWYYHMQGSQSRTGGRFGLVREMKYYNTG